MSNLLPFRTAHHCAFFGLSSDLVLCETTDTHRFPYQIKHELRGSNLSTHVCLHTHTHACTHTCTHRCAQVSACMHTHAHTHTHTHTHMHARSHARSQAHTHKHTHTCMHMYTCIHTHIFAHARTHTHTHTENLQLTHHSKLPSIRTHCPMGFSREPSGSGLPYWVSLCPSGIKPFTCHRKKCTHFRSVDKHLVSCCFYTQSTRVVLSG